MQHMDLNNATLLGQERPGVDDYRVLWNLDRIGWAWQWLRRDANFKEALKSSTYLTGVGRSAIRRDAMYELQPWGIMFR